MMIERKAWIGRWRVTFRFDTDMPGEGMRCDWEPAMPDPSALTKKERRRYRAARHQLLTEVANAIGIDVIVVDL